VLPFRNRILQRWITWSDVTGKVPGHLSKSCGLLVHLSPFFPFERVCVKGSLRIVEPTMSIADCETWCLLSNGTGKHLKGIFMPDDVLNGQIMG